MSYLWGEITSWAVCSDPIGVDWQEHTNTQKMWHVRKTFVFTWPTTTNTKVTSQHVSVYPLKIKQSYITRYIATLTHFPKMAWLSLIPAAYFKLPNITWGISGKDWNIFWGKQKIVQRCPTYERVALKVVTTTLTTKKTKIKNLFRSSFLTVWGWSMPECPQLSKIRRLEIAIKSQLALQHSKSLKTIQCSRKNFKLRALDYLIFLWKLTKDLDLITYTNASLRSLSWVGTVFIKSRCIP